MLDAGTEASEPQHARADITHRTGVRIAAALTALLILVSAAGFLWVERKHELGSAAEQGTSRAEHLAEHVQGALAMAEAALALLEANLNALPPGTELDVGTQRSMADIRLLLTSLPLPLSVQALGAEIRQAPDRGCAAYLTKPIAVDELFTLIEQHAR